MCYCNILIISHLNKHISYILMYAYSTALVCLQLADNQIIESKLIQVNKKKIAYIYVIPKKVVYLHRIQARILALHNEAIYILPLGVLYGDTFCLFAL